MVSYEVIFSRGCGRYLRRFISIRAESGRRDNECGRYNLSISSWRTDCRRNSFRRRLRLLFGFCVSPPRSCVSPPAISVFIIVLVMQDARFRYAGTCSSRLTVHLNIVGPLLDHQTSLFRRFDVQIQSAHQLLPLEYADRLYLSRHLSVWGVKQNL